MSISTTAPRHITRHWREPTRVRQLARFSALELQRGNPHVRRAAAELWETAERRHADMPDDVRASLDLPSVRVFEAILGLLRTGWTLRHQAIRGVELGLEEIAELTGFAKSTVAVALRWLGDGPIEVNGVNVGDGLGVVHRHRRFGAAHLAGTLRKVFRTSRMWLLQWGQALLQLGLELVDATKEATRRWPSQSCKEVEGTSDKGTHANRARSSQASGSGVPFAGDDAAAAARAIRRDLESLA